MIVNLEFAYVVGLHRDETREAVMKINLTMWLGQFQNEINEENGIVFVLFLSHDRQEFFIDGISNNLKTKIIEQINHFKTFDS